jgi:hypothetical protein
MVEANVVKMAEEKPVVVTELKNGEPQRVLRSLKSLQQSQTNA